MFYLRRTKQDVPAPLGLVDRLHAFHSESFPVAVREADSFKAESNHDITVEERRDVYTTQTLDEAIKAGDLNDTAATHAPAKEVRFLDNTGKTVRVGDHTPEPRTISEALAQGKPAGHIKGNTL